ncbi:MAG TPA: L,D-transpeptidase family protein [Streptosporangiaceae bacterium]|nr:L,D-transpeptidase family protein [Streptosporangiaceae bacterium]
MRNGAVGLAVLCCVAVMAAPAGAVAAAPRDRYPAGVRQLITVTAASRSATFATFRAYRIADGHVVEVFGPWTARVGYNGVAPPGRKREGDGRTPSGTYGFSFFFGVRPGDGFVFPYRHAYRYDFWDDDSASARYNEWVNAREHNPGARPEPMHQMPAYDYAAVITYNARRVPDLGSAIFLHVGTGTPTAGCVSLPRSELLEVLRWLRPRDDPRIRISAR